MIERIATRDGIESRFWQRVAKTDTCWEWLGWCDRAGYGVIKVAGRCTRAHRVAFYLHHGTNPPQVHHTCRNKRCVNPDHLEAVESLAAHNALHAGDRRRFCNRGHPLTPDNVIDRGRHSRICRTCHNARRIAYQETHNARRRQRRKERHARG